MTNELGMGIVPESAMVRRYRDLAGWLNQDAAATADLEIDDFVSAPESPAPTADEMPDWLAELTSEPSALTSSAPNAV